MFEIKNLDFGFMLLCPDMNPDVFSNTFKSLKKSHPECPIIGVAPSCIGADILKKLKAICDVFKSKENTITSMMNTGLRNVPSEWGIFIMSGSWVNKNITHKISKFIDNYSDIVFPIFDKITDFRRGAINGLCINRKVFKKVGPFAEIGAIDKCKEEWSIYAYGLCDSKFKAVLGVEI